MHRGCSRDGLREDAQPVTGGSAEAAPSSSQPARPASPSIPPASRPPCSSASASWRTRGRSRDPSGVRDAVPDPRGHLRLLRRRRPGLGFLLRRRRRQGRSPAAPHRGSSSGGSRSSLSRTTTRVLAKNQPLKMASGPGSGRISASAWLPAPSARGRAVECHKQAFPVASRRMMQRGSPRLKLCVRGSPWVILRY